MIICTENDKDFYKYKKSKIVKNVNGFYRTKNNIVYNGKKYYNEKELLEKKYVKSI